MGVAKPVDWEALLVRGYEPLKISQRVFRRLPQDPRCKLCQNPFGGIGGKLVGFTGRKPSRKNPNLCQFCFDHLPTGGIEIDIGVVFADVRASTALGETVGCRRLCWNGQRVLRDRHGIAIMHFLSPEGHAGNDLSSGPLLGCMITVLTVMVQSCKADRAAGLIRRLAGREALIVLPETRHETSPTLRLCHRRVISNEPHVGPFPVGRGYSRWSGAAWPWCSLAAVDWSVPSSPDFLQPPLLPLRWSARRVPTRLSPKTPRR